MSSHSQRPPLSLSSRILSASAHDSGYSSPSADSTHENGPDSHDANKDQVVTVPDMFSSIMAVEPVMNPNYLKVKSEGEAWIQRYFEPLFTGD